MSRFRVYTMNRPNRYGNYGSARMDEHQFGGKTPDGRQLYAAATDTPRATAKVETLTRARIRELAPDPFSDERKRLEALLTLEEAQQAVDEFAAWARKAFEDGISFENTREDRIATLALAQASELATLRPQAELSAERLEKLVEARADAGNRLDALVAAEAALAEQKRINEGLPEVLRNHFPMGVECDHAAKRDRMPCACASWHAEWQPTYGAAVKAWIAHVMEVASTHPTAGASDAATDIEKGK